MSVKQSLVDNQQEIIDSLPTDELKNEFKASLDTMEEPVAATNEQLVAEAQEAEHISEDMYAAVKELVERDDSVAAMSSDEQASAEKECLDSISTEPNENQEDDVQEEPAPE